MFIFLDDMIKNVEEALEKFDSVVLMEETREEKVYTFKALGKIV